MAQSMPVLISSSHPSTFPTPGAEVTSLNFWVIEDYVKPSLDERTVVFSDKASNYVNIADHVQAHMTVISDRNRTNDTLKWVHIAISNAKRTLLGIYHRFKGFNLKVYLDEFCYVLNRKMFAS